MRRLFGLLILSGLAFVTFRQCHVWQSEETLWTRAVVLSPLSPRPHINLALEYAKQGRYVDAMAHFQEASRLTHDDRRMQSHQRASWGMAELNISAILLVQGRYEEAHAVAGRILEVFPTMTQAHVTRGTAALAMGNCDAASMDYWIAGVAELPNCHKGD